MWKHSINYTVIPGFHILKTDSKTIATVLHGINQINWYCNIPKNTLNIRYTKGFENNLRKKVWFNLLENRMHIPIHCNIWNILPGTSYQFIWIIVIFKWNYWNLIKRFFYIIDNRQHNKIQKYTRKSIFRFEFQNF